MLKLEENIFVGIFVSAEAAIKNIFEKWISLS